MFMGILSRNILTGVDVPFSCDSVVSNAALPDIFVGTHLTSPAPLNVGLRDSMNKLGINNIGRGRGKITPQLVF